MRPRAVTVTLTTADADGIAKAQTPSGAGNLTLDGDLVSGGSYTADAPRRILLTTAADETAKTFTVYGTDRAGKSITEVLTGVDNTTVYTNQDFATVTRVAVSAATTGAITIGTNGVGSSQWLMMNYDAQHFEVGIGVTILSGSPTYSIENTHDDLMGYYSPGGVWNEAAVPLARPDGYLAGMANNGETIVTIPCVAVRLTLLAVGSAKMIATQSGIAG